MELAGTDVSPRAPDDGGCGPAAAFAADHLRQWILDGEFRPGTPLVSSQLGRRIGVKAPAVREALSLLDGEGLVHPAGMDCRFEVARLTPLDLAATYEVREGLDSLGARLAAATGLSADVEERFAAATAAMAEARSLSLDQDAFTRAHAAWHLALFDASGNRQLRKSSRLVRVASHCLVWRSLPPAGQRLFGITVREIADSTLDDHARILRAIRNGDADNAAHAAWRHVRRSTNFARVVGNRLAAQQEHKATG
jgi:DNA-binding GntR family transcriptional regulator